MSDSLTDIDALGCRALILKGVERRFIASEAAWFGYRELRSMISHVYDPAKAGRVFTMPPAFLQDAQVLLAKLIPASA